MSFEFFHPTMVGKKVYFEYREWEVYGEGDINTELELMSGGDDYWGPTYKKAPLTEIQFKKDKDEQLIAAHVQIDLLKSLVQDLTWRVENLETRLDRQDANDYY